MLMAWLSEICSQIVAIQMLFVKVIGWKTLKLKQQMLYIMLILKNFETETTEWCSTLCWFWKTLKLKQQMLYIMLVLKNFETETTDALHYADFEKLCNWTNRCSTLCWFWKALKLKQMQYIMLILKTFEIETADALTYADFEKFLIWNNRCSTLCWLLCWFWKKLKL